MFDETATPRNDGGQTPRFPEHISVSPLGTPRNDSEQSLPQSGRKNIFNLKLISMNSSTTLGARDEFGRSCTTLATEQTHKNGILHWWWMEICSAIVAIITMAVLIAVLVKQDQQPIRSWDHGQITVNTVVAAISTVAQLAAMFPVSGAISQAMWIWFAARNKADRSKSRLEDLEIFDEASRGAWGSALLLWRLKSTFHLASIGAILTIASLGFDIFTQQVIGYQEINVAARNDTMYKVGNVPRLEHYTDYTHGGSMSSWMPTLPAKAAIINSFFSETISPLPISCSTGNCSWPIVPSAAVCGECSATTYVRTCKQMSNISTLQTCNYTMDSGTSVSVVDEDLGLNLVFTATPTYNGSIYNLSDPTTAYIATFDLMYAPFNSSSPKPKWSNVSATECGLWFCMQAYNTQITDSESQQVSTNWSNIQPIENPSFNLTAMRNFTDIPSSFNIAPNSSYSVLGASLTALAMYFHSENMFNGNISAGAANTASSSDYMLQLWDQSDDLDAWIKRLAMGITNYMRISDPSAYDEAFYNGTAHDYYKGMAFLTQAHVQVRWGWLAFPLILIVLSVILLILSIWRTRGSHIGAWKSSPLALLFADVDEVIKARAGNSMNAAGGLTNSVGEMRAFLRPERLSSRWVFRAVGEREKDKR